MRFFCGSIETESVLDPVESHHLCRVLRAQKGTPVELFDGKGTLAEGVVERIDKKHTLIRSETITRTAPPASGRVILAVSFAKGQRFDWLVEKCTELGVDHIAAVQFDRTVKLGKDTAMQRYRKISITAAKQSRRLFLPEVTGPAKFQGTLDLLTRQYPQSRLLYGEPEGVRLSEQSDNPQSPDHIILIGPEGGLTEDEKHLLSKSRATGVSINRNILRIETAAMAFCSILCSLRR
ncbi:MAG: RsmE family RNA methyltransferase [Planctomycetota bacterium]|jgi:16S rRNA (uracil1498-N3)-methyltransferase